MNLTPTQIIAARVTKNYGRLQCRQCATMLRREFKRAGLTGHILKLESVGTFDRGWIVMSNSAQTLPFPVASGQDAISENGRHYGVEVNGVVYDNIFRQGIAAAIWEQQFACSTNNFKVSTHKPF